jgi:hypothetical protein
LVVEHAHDPKRARMDLSAQRMRRVCDRRSGPQRGGDHRGLDDLCFGRARSARIGGMDFNAIRALRSERDRDGNQFLVFHRNCPVGDSRLVEGPERVHDLGREEIHLLKLREIFFLIHMS